MKKSGAAIYLEQECQLDASTVDPIKPLISPNATAIASQSHKWLSFRTRTHVARTAFVVLLTTSRLISDAIWCR